MLEALNRAIADLWKKLNELPPPAAVPIEQNAPLAASADVNALAGKALDYLIGVEDGRKLGQLGRITEGPYGTAPSPMSGLFIAYCNLRREDGEPEAYGPYDPVKDDIFTKYGEGRPIGAGFVKNITEQLDRAHALRHQFAEQDNPDSYPIADVMRAVAMAEERGLGVVAKNPLNMKDGAVQYLAHPNIFGAIVEEDCGTPDEMNDLRARAGKADLPVWFVGYQNRARAVLTGKAAARYRNMSVTYSHVGEYASSEDMLLPNAVSVTVSPSVAPKPAQNIPNLFQGNTPQANPHGAEQPPDPLEYADDYKAKWASMKIDPSRVDPVERIAKRLIANKPRYQKIEALTGVPWFVVATLHQRESDCDFTTHLHNGDSLNARTYHVPAGRPAKGSPPFTFEDSAVDALTGAPHYLGRVREWPIERIGYETEKYNGWGYHKHGVSSAYLWSFSSVYKGGKYVADGVWSGSARDQQCGTMPMLRAMMGLDPSVKIDGQTVASIVTQPESPRVEPTPEQAPGSFLDRIILAMRAKGYRIDTGPDEVNICYPEGHDRTGVKNSDLPGYWNDVRCVFTYRDGKPVMLGMWTATTRPGPYFTHSRINPLGAANIVPGQYADVWQVGLHRGAYEALVQRGTIKVARDDNEDFRREGDKIETGDFEGVNQHHGSNSPVVGAHSAGCIVGRMTDGHEEFMSIVKRDPRYLANHAYKFTTTILAQSEVPL